MIGRNQVAPEMIKDLTNVNNELAECEARLTAIRIINNMTSVDRLPVNADQSNSKEPSQLVTHEKASDATGSQPSLAEYKEVIANLEKSNMEMLTVNEQLAVKVADLENEKASLIKELQRLQVEIQELRMGTAAGNADGPGEYVKLNKEDTVEEEQDNKREEDSEEETEGEQEAEFTSVQQLKEETIADKGEVWSEDPVVMA